MLFKNISRQFLFIIFFLSLFAFTCTRSYSQYVRYTEDTAKFAFSLFAKAGVVYDYPFFQNYSDPSPIGEIGANILFDKVQVGVGVGFFMNNSYWNQGADATNPAKTGTTQAGNFYMPLHANFKLFNIKRNFFTLKLGFIFLLSTSAYYTETTMFSTISYPFNQTRFGLAGTVGFKYSRHIGERILLGAELSLNLSFLPAPAMLLGTNYTYGYNMISRNPNGDFKICFEYVLGKKHINYLDLSKRKKPKKVKGDIIDEE